LSSINKQISNQINSFQQFCKNNIQEFFKNNLNLKVPTTIPKMLRNKKNNHDKKCLIKQGYLHHPCPKTLFKLQ